MGSYIPPGATIQGVDPNDAEAQRKARERIAAQPTNGNDSVANFELSTEANKARNAALGEAAEIEQTAAARGAKMAGQEALTIPERMARDKANQDATHAVAAEQARRGGVETADAVTDAGGIAGFFGGKGTTKHFTAGKQEDTTTAGHKAKINALADTVSARAAQAMTGAELGQATQVGPAATIATGPQDQMRARQNSLLDQLSGAAAGTSGPSAAEMMLKRGADRAQAAALSRAAAAGTPGAQRQASFEAAGAIQDAAGQAGIIRAQEQQAAQGLLASTAQGARGQDIGLATDQAGLEQGTAFKQADLTQQTALTQAGLTQDTAKTNLLTGIEQQKTKDETIAKLLAAGYSMDQAKQQADLQQAQFNAKLLADQAAADKGVAASSSAAGGQALGAAAGAVATTLASMSDKREKKNVSDGDKEIESFLDHISAKGFEYKDKSNGAGHRVGVMAQDVEKSKAGDAAVVERGDGAKMLDINKSVGLALASLGNINKRLKQLGA